MFVVLLPAGRHLFAVGILRGAIDEPPWPERERADVSGTGPVCWNGIEVPRNLVRSVFVVHAPSTKIRPRLLGASFKGESDVGEPLPASQEFVPAELNRVIGPRIVIHGD